MTEYVLNVTLPILAPVLSASTAAGEFGIDSLFGRGPSGELLISGTHVKGRLLEALRNLQGPLDVADSELADWFGAESPGASHDQTGGGRDEPKRGRLRFGDFTAPASDRASVRHRIAIDPVRGAVRKGHLLSIESTHRTGEVVEFCGEIRFFAEEEEAAEIRGKLLSGLRWIPALGGQRSAGFGQLRGPLKCEMTRVPRTKPQVQSFDDTFEIALAFDSPFCVAKRPISENLFESDSVISGAAIKGAFAATLNQLNGRQPGAIIDGSLPEPWQALGEKFAGVRFTHAFPASKGGERPTQIPLSLVSTVDDEFFDIALASGPRLFAGQAPFFQIDWKDETIMAARSRFGWTDNLKRQLRVRTAIDPESRRADEGRLFAYEMVEPGEHHWLCRVMLPPGSSEDLRGPLFRLFEAGLTHFGKTKIDGRVEVVQEWPLEKLDAATRQWIVTLQSPALILDSDPDLNSSLAGEASLAAAYRNYWETESGGSLELVRFFAAQQLAGGGYLMRRFRAEHAWKPFVLTRPGSVFVLRAVDGTKAVNRLANWRVAGLPVTQPFKGDSWRTCPYVPENGFGEIAVRAATDSDLEIPGSEAV